MILINQYLIFDIAGRVVKRGMYTNSNVPILLDEFGPGLYFIGFPNSVYPTKQFVISH